MDAILYELHSTIEHVRISSMISHLASSSSSCGDLSQEAPPTTGGESLNLSELLTKSVGVEGKVAEVALICRQFITTTKKMISSGLLNEKDVTCHMRDSTNALCSLVVHSFDTTFEYVKKNVKLDETRHLLIQILNMINTFRITLNITYLAVSKQLNQINMDVLLRQATSLANEISVLIKLFKLLI